MEAKHVRTRPPEAYPAPQLVKARLDGSNADGALPLVLREASTQVRRIEKLLSLCAQPNRAQHEITRQFSAVWQADRHFAVVRSSFPHQDELQHYLLSSALIQRLDQYKQVFQEGRNQVQAQRLSGWKKSLLTSEDTLTASAFRWLNAPIRPFNTPLGPVRSLRVFFDHLADFWRQLWCRHTGQESWQEARCMIRAARFPQLQLPPLTGQDLKAALRRSPGKSATGVDGWTHEEMMCLSPLAWDALALVWNQLEDRQNGRMTCLLGRWQFLSLEPQVRTLLVLDC